MTKSTGGLAFPSKVYTLEGYPNGYDMGMTLRDWFAGQALPAAMRSYGPEGAAEEAYQYAEAMIARRAMLAAREVAK